jgi:TRAP-type mannitol/chloroaromatic compound transport system permease small subunit
MTVIGYVLLALLGIAALIYCLNALGPSQESDESSGILLDTAGTRSNFNA